MSDNPKDIRVSYPGDGRPESHFYIERWEKSPYYCPACSHSECWHETSGGDYYVGELYLCKKCGSRFYLPNGAEPDPRNNADRQRLEAIRGGHHD